MHNSLQTPQDAGWGQSLVVLSPVVDFANLPEDAPCALGESTSGCSVIAQDAESEGESESSSGASVFGSPVSTVLQTPCLLTPIDEEEEFDLIMFASSPPRDSRLSSAIGDDSPLVETPEEAPEGAGMYCNDEDDDLPPLGGWYQDIAACSGYILLT